MFTEEQQFQFWLDVRHEVLLQRDWAGYAEACLTHDNDEPVVEHAAELAAGH
jgi:hypothetical protein